MCGLDQVTGFTIYVGAGEGVRTCQIVMNLIKKSYWVVGPAITIFCRFSSHISILVILFIRKSKCVLIIEFLFLYIAYQSLSFCFHTQETKDQLNVESSETIQSPALKCRSD